MFFARDRSSIIYLISSVARSSLKLVSIPCFSSWVGSTLISRRSLHLNRLNLDDTMMWYKFSSISCRWLMDFCTFYSLIIVSKIICALVLIRFSGSSKSFDIVVYSFLRTWISCLVYLSWWAVDTSLMERSKHFSLSKKISYRLILTQVWSSFISFVIKMVLFSCSSYYNRLIWIWSSRFTILASATASYSFGFRAI